MVLLISIQQGDNHPTNNLTASRACGVCACNAYAYMNALPYMAIGFVLVTASASMRVPTCVRR